MNRKIGVVLVDGNEVYRSLLREHLDACGDFAVIASVGSGSDGLRAIEELHPQVVVMELILSGLDGIGLLDHIMKGPNHPKIIILSQWMQSEIIQSAFEHGADYFIGKPCDFDSLTERMRESVSRISLPYNKKEPDVEQITADVLHRLGVSPLHTPMVLKMVLLVVEDPSRLHAINKEIYSACFEKEDDNVKRIEHNLRYAIAEAWKRGDPEFQQRLFRNTISSNSGKPSNGNFLAAVSEYIRMELQRRGMVTDRQKNIV